ncbi:MAG: hypothetical protein LBP87_13745 [Planctomycetaceae bacterium]|jgi:hypothetical protein|nr:hypothetical protein [Planctomycetaceae bacterium]
MIYLLSLFFIIWLGMFGVTESGAASNDVWQTTVNVQWQETPLGESLKRLAETQKIGLLIDRRLDPSTPIRFESTGQSLGKMLQQLAESLDYGCVLFESTVYFSTKESVAILPVLLSEQQNRLEKLTPRRVTIFRRKKSFPIPFLSEPKEILKKLAFQNNFRWKNLEVLPHDLWDEKSLNNLSINELLTILLIGFEMTFEIEGEGETLVIVPLSQLKSVPSSSANIESPSENTKQNIRNIQNISEQKNQAIQKNQKISDTQNTKNLPQVPLSQRRFTLKVENQRLDILLQSLTERLHLKLEVNEKSLADKGVQADNRVSFDVKNVTAAQLFRAILRPLKLDFQIKDETLRVW